MSHAAKFKTTFITIRQWKNQQENLLEMYFYMEIPRQSKLSADINPMQIPSIHSTYLLKGFFQRTKSLTSIRYILSQLITNIFSRLFLMW